MGEYIFLLPILCVLIQYHGKLAKKKQGQAMRGKLEPQDHQGTLEMLLCMPATIYHLI